MKHSKNTLQLNVSRAVKVPIKISSKVNQYIILDILIIVKKTVALI